MSDLLSKRIRSVPMRFRAHSWLRGLTFQSRPAPPKKNVPFPLSATATATATESASLGLRFTGPGRAGISWPRVVVLLLQATLLFLGSWKEEN